MTDLSTLQEAIENTDVSEEFKARCRRCLAVQKLAELQKKNLCRVKPGTILVALEKGKGEI